MDNKQPEAKKEPTRYYIRFSESADYENISRFYNENRHHNVRARDQELMRNLAANGSVVLLEDEKGKLVGTTVSYPLVSTDANGQEHQKWSEIGSVRFILNGYPGIFDVMAGMSMLRTFLVEPPEDRFVAKIGHPAVQKMSERIGWREFTPDPLAVELAAKTKRMEDDVAAPPDSGSNPKWYQAGLESLPITAKFMASVMDNPVLTNKKTGEQVIIDFSRSPLATIMTPTIRNLASKDLGPVDQPDTSPERGLAKARDRWMRKFFR